MARSVCDWHVICHGMWLLVSGPRRLFSALVWSPDDDVFVFG